MPLCLFARCELISPLNSAATKVTPCMFPPCLHSFVFMALMEYCLVNIVLGDSPDPNETPSLPERSKMEKLYDFTMRSRRSMSSTVS